MQALVIGRLISPGSEVHTHHWLQSTSALYEFTGEPLHSSLNSLYRAGDRLFDCKDALESHLSTRERDLFDLPERLCLFGLTNTYFEGQEVANAKAQRGHSKEKCTDCKLLTFALVVDEDGFPKYSRLYPGNQAEGQTLAQIIESLLELRPNLADSPICFYSANETTTEDRDGDPGGFQEPDRVFVKNLLLGRSSRDRTR